MIQSVIWLMVQKSDGTAWDEGYTCLLWLESDFCHQESFTNGFANGWWFFWDSKPMGFISIFSKHLGNRFFSQPPNKPKFTNYQTIAMMVDLALWAMTVWPDILVEALLYCILSSDRSRLQDRDEIYYGAYVREVFFSVSFTNAIMTLKANISILH